MVLFIFRRFPVVGFILRIAVWAFAVDLHTHSASAQILMSGGTYSQNFDLLAGSGAAEWMDNVTLPGWYASQSASPYVVTNYDAGTGSRNKGSLYSFGADGSADRAFGSVASGTPGDFAYGVRFTNDTSFAETNFVVSFTGEQWRNGGNTNVQKLAFSYRISNSAITSSAAANPSLWTPFAALDFVSPTVGPTATALDGNNPANREVFSNVTLAGVVVYPGQEIFFRWFDANDAGNDHGLAVDDLTIAFQATNSPRFAPYITGPPQSQAVGEGGTVMFTASAIGNPLPDYQWQLNGTNLAGKTSSTLILYDVGASQAGDYSVVATNVLGSTNSLAATLIVTPASLSASNGAITLLTYNVHGNGVADWSTNTTWAQAIGRELKYLKPDIIAFNEIPTNGVPEMANWVKAFLPHYYLATNSITDGYIQSCIASRFPILNSSSHLHASSLSAYGYDGDGFTRDLFEAQIGVLNWPLPLHVFVAHLKATSSDTAQDDADKRAAEASAISNYMTTVFLAGPNKFHPYILVGDMNEDVFFPDNSYASGHPIQRLTGPPTGLKLTTPVNPVTHADLTESIQTRLDMRFDYLLPCGLLFSNIAGSEIFRTDLLNPLPPDLNSNDDKIASDHLPVLMVFNNLFNAPFRLLSIGMTNQVISLQWESASNRQYSVESSPDLNHWTSLATNLLADGTNFTFSANAADEMKFYRVYRAP